MNRPKYKKLYNDEKLEKERYKEMFEHLIRILKEVDINITDTTKPSYNSFSKVRQICIKNNGKECYVAYEEV